MSRFLLYIIILFLILNVKSIKFSSPKAFIKIIEQAEKTFDSTPEHKPEDLHAFRKLVNDLGIFFPSYFLSEELKESVTEPCLLFNVYQSTFYTITLFILLNGTTIPVHNYPAETGFFKVLYGHLEINSFSNLEPFTDSADLEVGEHIRVHGESEIFSPDSGVVQAKALNEFKAVNSTTAYVDIRVSPKFNGSEYQEIIVEKELFLEKVRSFVIPDGQICADALLQLLDKNF